MSEKIKILVPELPESVHHAKIVKWHKKIGDYIIRDDLLVDLETDKIIIEVPASTSGKLIFINKDVGKLVKNKDLLCYIKKKKKYSQKISIKKENLSPSLRRKIKLSHKKDEKFIKKISLKEKIIEKKSENNDTNFNKNFSVNKKLKIKKIIEMSSFRQIISQKLVKSKNKTAMLTTFNEVNMSSIIKIRKKFGEKFRNKHNIKLGLMSFFVKSVILALKNFPQINTSIYRNKIIFYDSLNINIAISTDRGLVAPVLFSADKMSMSDIEKKINFYSIQGKNGKLTLDDLNGGTFTITNGGVFGSLLSTPIINYPQTAILGIHTIKKRPIVHKNKDIIIAPMMYISLSYDHRLIDGKDSVGFLMKIKNTLENFINISLDI
ncbi:MAG: dihydrolipoyllysine-residue succinyltransferase [Buchnera aphidicola (Periphyllus acericola)]|uniref:dihydrolipoyllysine-residue succinyltransferase n=1 Tax=Buchnera aphidicola TaxID=9 RepID=UPI0030D08ECC|nr:dihydrolipoyllysine-residue succinyltransferase [Buchnera aphidicola (Periphyllus acericola)]